MRLLVFAHRGEAQSFLKYFKLTPHPRMQELYYNSQVAILICGEGIYNALYATSSALEILENITVIFNYGIVGCIDEKFEIGSVIEIKTVYAQDEFKSFPLMSTHCEYKADCLTVKNRVTKIDEAQKLLPISNIVDRELWGIAFSAKNKNIPLVAIKVISDHISQASSCDFIKDNALVFSESLLQEFLNLLESESKSELCFETQSFDIFNDKKFYFTISLKREVSRYLSSLISRDKLSEEEILKHIKIHEIKNEDILPKLRSKILVDRLDHFLFPIKYKIKNKIAEISLPFSKEGFQLRFDETLESPSFSIHAEIKNENDLEKLQKAIRHFNYQDFFDLRAGKIDFEDTRL